MNFNRRKYSTVFKVPRHRTDPQVTDRQVADF
jgi:hypothetical protein